MSQYKMIGLFLMGLMSSMLAGAQYIYEILEYLPAPGQHINGPAGTPDAAQSIIGTTTGLVSLGAFGGYIVFRFDRPVPNDPSNPYGIDFTIFGNSIGSWSEPGIVSVMKDENRNGLADDTWFELAGSEYYSDDTDHRYVVTYTNPGGTDARDVSWTDNRGGSGYVFANPVHSQPYYPGPPSFNGMNMSQYSLEGTRIYAGVDSSDNLLITSPPLPYGYADNHQRGGAPFTTPDNPLTPGTEGAGGDPMDIAWAVDQDGQPVSLDTIHFVRVHTAVNGHAGALGEISTDISGAAIVEKAATGESLIFNNPGNTACRIYPNPVQNTLFVSGQGPVRFRLSDLSGKVLYEAMLNGDTHTLDMSGCMPGLYLVQIFNDYSWFTEKLMVR